MGEMLNSFSLVLETFREEITRHRWEDNIKMYLR
jgi:hypothetical protein